MKPILVIVCMLVFCQPCLKQAQDPFCILPGLTEMIRNQTQCADAWRYGEPNEETIVKRCRYLVQQHIAATTIDWQS